MIFIIRLYAIYSGSWTLVRVMACLLVAEVAVKIVRFYLSLFHGDIYGCVYSGPLSMWGVWFCPRVSLAHVVMDQKKISRRSRRVHTRRKGSTVWTTSLWDYNVLNQIRTTSDALFGLGLLSSFSVRCLHKCPSRQECWPCILKRRINCVLLDAMACGCTQQGIRGKHQLTPKLNSARW